MKAGDILRVWPEKDRSAAFGWAYVVKRDGHDFFECRFLGDPLLKWDMDFGLYGDEFSSAHARDIVPLDEVPADVVAALAEWRLTQ